MIFDIQRCSIHDGSGLRTLVFFKGCPLRCIWCANPESQSYKPEVMEAPAKCIGCEKCISVCPEHIIGITKDGYRADRSKCVQCYECTKKCFTNARSIAGRAYGVDELFKEINKDRMFYTMYGGGVTFSGGEPLAQPEYLVQIAKKCKENRINTAIESCGYGDYDKFKEALEYIDYAFLDIKHIDSEIHKRLTGVGNERVLKNVELIVKTGLPTTIRTPVVPGHTDSDENIVGIAKFIYHLPSIEAFELLKYHQLGEMKYKALGRPYSLAGVEPPGDDRMRELVRLANKTLKGSGKQCFYTLNNNKEVD